MILQIALAKSRPYWGLFLLVAVVVIVMTVPSTGYLLKLQSYMATMDDNDEPIPPLWTGVDQTVPHNASEAVYIASYRFDETSAKLYWDMIRRYPNEAALYANVLSYYTGSKNSPLAYEKLEQRDQDERRRISQNPETRSARSKALIQALHAVSMGSKLEPENIYFDLCHAYLLFGEGHDKEAMAVIHRASGKTSYDSHYQDRLDAALLYGTRPVFPVDVMYPAWKVYIKECSDFRYAVAFKSVYRLAVWNQHRNDPDKLFHTMSDLMRIGGTMRDSSDSVLETLVAAGIQRNALVSSSQILQGQSPRQMDGKNSSNKANQQTNSIQHHLSQFRNIAGESLPENTWRQWKREAVKTDLICARIHAYTQGKQASEWVARPMMMTMTGGKLFIAIFWAACLWLITFVWLAVRRHLDIEGVGPSPILLWLVILIPAIPFKHLLSADMGFSVAGSVLVRLVLGTAITAVPAVFLMAILCMRVVPGFGRLDTFAARLRRGCSVALVGLFVMYIATIALNFAVAKHAEGKIDRLCAGEMKLVRTYPVSAGQ